MCPESTKISPGIPPEQRITASGGVLCMAEYGTSGKGQQTGGGGALQSEPKAVPDGVPGSWRSSHLQQSCRERNPPVYPGSKNWLFCDTPKGAEASAIVYSLVESAKANGVEPFAYLQHVLVQLPYLGKTHSHEELETLMPWAPYIQQNFAMKNSNAYTNCYLD